jgi:diguanylate cyclase (GGDEF)-like protein
MHHAQTESNALTDSLTGLPNSARLQLRFEQEVSRARRNNKPFQVVCSTSTTSKGQRHFGHKIGDRMLREVANLIQSQLANTTFSRAMRAMSSSRCFRI